MSARQERGVPVWVAVGVAVAIVAVVVAGGLVAYFALRGPAPVSAPAPTAVPSASASATSTPMQAAPTDSPTSTAVGFVTAFTNHTVPDDVWEQQYSSYLTERAKTAYEGTNRDRVPGTRVTGPADVTAGVSATPIPGAADDDGDQDPVPAIVTVPTDAGTYTVNLQQQDGRWLVVSAQLPGSDQ